MIVKFSTLKSRGLFVKVPEIYNNFVIKKYNHAGTWLMETDSLSLKHWKESLPILNYIVIGDAASVTDDSVSCIVEYNGDNKWFNYITNEFSCSSSKESFISLMSKCNVYNNINKHHKEKIVGMIEDDQHKEGKEVKLTLRTGKWIVLLEGYNEKN